MPKKLHTFCELLSLNWAAVFFIRQLISRVSSMLHNLPSLPGAWILSLSFTLAGRYALVILHLHKQECYYNMMECCVFLLYLWDAVIRRKSKLVIRRLMFIVRLPCLETFDKQRVAKAGKKRCWRILWELAKIIPHSAQLPCENASPHWLIFHRQNERFAVWAQWWITPKHIPYGKSGWCRREGEASSSDKLPSLPVSPCSFLLSVLLLLLEEEGWGGLFCQVEVISSSARHLEIPSGSGVSGSEAGRTGISIGNQATQQKKSLRWWFAPSALSIPVRSREQAAVGWRPDKLPSWLVGRFPVWIPGMFLTGCSAHPLQSCRLERQGRGPRG